jgi:hypothetical protein
MWTGSHSIVTKEVTKEQMWKLFAEINNWATWDKSIDYAKLEGNFEKGNHFYMRPKGGPKVKLIIHEIIVNKNFTDKTNFPLATMYGEHLLEETSEGLKITCTMKVRGLLSFLWVKLVAKNIVADLPTDMQIQINVASKL